MPKLHELLAAEKTPTAAWHSLHQDTLKKFKNASHFFEGHTKSLKMIEESPQNQALEAAAREEKPVITTVRETLRDAFELFVKAEDLQAQKNATNRVATGDVVVGDAVLLRGLPIDELLGLEARLKVIRELFEAIPTLDAARTWRPATQQAAGHFEANHAEDTTKTEKVVVPVILKDATKEHPAQVQAIGKDVVVGSFTTLRRSGAATALQKFEALKNLDNLIVAVKQARMRANETLVVDGMRIGSTLAGFLLAPLEADE